MTVVERLAQEARQRIVDGVVDEWGKHCPDGPRKRLTDAQWRAYVLALPKDTQLSFHMERSIKRRTVTRR
jgi:hypothetical protein